MTKNTMLMNLLIYLTFILFSLGQIGRISFANQQVNIYLYELGIILFLVVGLFKYKLRPIKESWKKFRILYVFLFILLFSLVINIPRYNLWQNFVAFLYWSRLTMYFLFFSYCFNVLKQQNNKQVFKKAINLFIILTVIFSLVQYFFYPDLRNLFYLGWDPHLYRMFGLFFDTSVAGAIYGMIFLYLMEKGEGKPGKLRRVGGLGIIGVAVVLSFSRSTYLGFLVALGFNLIAKKKVKLFAILLYCFIAILLVAPKPAGEGVNLARIFSIESRLTNYQEGISIWKKYPIFGIGYNHIGEELGRLGILANHARASYHSSFLIILVTGGVVGLLGFLGVLGKLGRVGKSGLLGKTIILFLSILSLSDNILLHPFILFLLLVFLVGDS